MRFVGLNYAEYMADQEKSGRLKADIVAQLEATSPIDGATFVVTQLLEGSIIAVFEITLPAGTTQTEIDALTTTIEDDPGAFFDDSFISSYGITNVAYVAPEVVAALAAAPSTVPGSTDEPPAPSSGGTQPAGPPEEAEAPGPDTTVFVAEVDDGSDGINIAVIVVPVVVGVVLIGGVAGFFALRSCNSRKNRAFLDDL